MDLVLYIVDFVPYSKFGLFVLGQGFVLLDLHT